MGPVAFSGGFALLLLAPLVRGGNRYPALLVLELVALWVLLALWLRGAPQGPSGWSTIMPPSLLVLLSAPLLVTLVQLAPLPPALWAALPGHELYTQTLEAANAPPGAWRPLSVSPDTTAASLLAGLPVIAAFLLGYLASNAQLRMLLRLAACLALAQVALALAQVAGGQESALYFGLTSNRPIGTFANSNHLANYLCMALTGLIWLAHELDRHHRQRSLGSIFRTPAQAIGWSFAALLLVLGVLLSLSRGAAMFGLTTAAAAFAVVFLRLEGVARAKRFVLPAVALLVAAAVIVIGADTATSRATASEFTSSAGYRGLLARTSLDAAAAFWPTGSGWGTYAMAYPRFQPPQIAGFANHAHMDYVEMLVEGGALFLVTAAAFLWLAGQRAALLITTALRDRRLDRDAMASAVCGLGLLGFLLHSLVEFNMRIPANAILAAVLAGVYLRPLAKPAFSHDRPAQPHPAGH